MGFAVVRSVETALDLKGAVIKVEAYTRGGCCLTLLEIRHQVIETACSRMAVYQACTSCVADR